MPIETPVAASNVSLSLASAVITTSPFPLLLLDHDLQVVACSASFCDAFGIDGGVAAHRSFFDLGAGEWNNPTLRGLLMETAAGGARIKAYALDLETPGAPVRRIILNAHKLDYADVAQIRLLVSVVEAADARAPGLLSDKLHAESVTLLKEVRHRTANSLQIIGSVLLLTANRSKSEDVRSQLQDAYLRVMSVAALERQLAPAETGDVALRPYFETLCERIGASLITDPSQVAIEIEVEDRTVPADLSISIGLIVTELVINALKHAFPDGRKGKVTIGYRGCEAGWALTVRDDGIGRRVEAAAGKSGLGTMIVEALARQHGAIIETIDAEPGTLVSIVIR